MYQEYTQGLYKESLEESELGNFYLLTPADKNAALSLNKSCSCMALIMGEGINSDLYAIIQCLYCTFYGFSMIMMCKQGKILNHEERLSLLDIFNPRASSRSLAKDAEIINNHQYYTDIFLRPYADDWNSPIFARLFQGNLKTYISSKFYDIDIIIPVCSIKLSDLVSAAKEKQYLRYDRCYSSVYVFAGRGAKYS